MRRIAIAAIALLLVGVSPVLAVVWVGPGSATGQVAYPPSYLEAVALLEMTRLDFDGLTDGANMAGHDLGGVVLQLGVSPDGLVVARSGLVAGAEPSSSPMALLVGGASYPHVPLDIEIFETVESVGFVLMGLDTTLQLRVFNQEETLISQYVIPVFESAQRRRIGIWEAGTPIGRLELLPQVATEYAIDDLELGTSMPEPATLSLVLLGWGMLAARRGRGRLYP